MEHMNVSIKAAVGATYDVIVVGGGPAGCAAALAARRAGHSTLLMEKGSYLGGLATLGLVVLYNPPLDDGHGRKLVGGIAEELLHASMKYGFDDLDQRWHSGGSGGGSGRYQTLFSAPAFALTLLERLREAGVALLLDAAFAQAVMDGPRCRGVVAHTRAGHHFYRAQALVDATGDGLLMHSAGARCVDSDTNWLTYWAQMTTLSDLTAAAAHGDLRRAVRIAPLGAKANGDNSPPGARQYGIRTPEEVSDFIQQGQLLALDKLRAMDRREGCFLSLPGMPQYRKTRRIQGLYTLSEADRGRHFDDAVGCVAEEYDARHLVEIPYRCLVSPDCENILAAGRIVSCEGRTMDTIRLIAVAALTGEAAGTAAAEMIEQGSSAADLDTTALSERLIRAGNILHF